METKILKRINSLPQSDLDKHIETLKLFNITLYNQDNIIDYNDFKDQCKDSFNQLYKYEIPDERGIRPQLCTLMACVEMLVGIRNMGEFLDIWLIVDRQE